MMENTWFDNWQQIEAAHAWHVDIRDQQDDLLADMAIEYVQSRLTGEG